jgi:hypothetical protein
MCRPVYIQGEPYYSQLALRKILGLDRLPLFHGEEADNSCLCSVDLRSVAVANGYTASDRYVDEQGVAYNGGDWVFVPIADKVCADCNKPLKEGEVSWCSQCADSYF